MAAFQKAEHLDRANADALQSYKGFVACHVSEFLVVTKSILSNSEPPLHMCDSKNRYAATASSVLVGASDTTQP